MPDAKVVRHPSTGYCEEATNIHISRGAVHRHSIDTIVHAAAKGRPCAAVPAGYIVGTHPTRCVEVATYIDIAIAAHCYCIDRAVCANAKGRPCAAVPVGYVVGTHPASCSEVTTCVHIAITAHC